MTKLLTAVACLAAGLAAAQTPPQTDAAPPQSAQAQQLHQEIRADEKEIRADKRDIRKDNADQRAQIAALNVQEKEAMDAVTADASLSKADGNAAKRKIHADFKSKKDAIRAQMKVARKAKRAAIRVERDDIQKDRQELRQSGN